MRQTAVSESAHNRVDLAAARDHDDYVVTFECYTGLQVTTGRLVELRWTDFIKLLRRPQIVAVTHQQLADKVARNGAKAQLPLWRFVTSAKDPPSRAAGVAETITGVCALVLDCDGDHDPIEMQGKLAKFRHCGYTTFSNSIGGRVCLRIVVPLSHPIAPALYRAWWERVALHLGGMADSSAAKFTQGYFAPGVPSLLRTEYEFWEQPGELLNPDEWPPEVCFGKIPGVRPSCVAQLEDNLSPLELERRASRAELLAALACVFADDRPTWFEIGCAVKRTGWGDAFSQWLTWSKTTRNDNYTESEAHSTWNSINNDRDITITPGRIIFEARKNGFDAPGTQPSHPVAAYWQARRSGRRAPEALEIAEQLNQVLARGPLAAYALRDGCASVEAWLAEISPPQDHDWIAKELPDDKYTFDSEPAAVAWMNQRIAYLARGNVIIDRALADDDGDPFQYVRVRDARDTFANIRVAATNGDKLMVKPAFDIWMKSPQRREYRKVTFDAAGFPLPPRTLNLYRGLGVQPRKGDFSLIRRHIREVICGGDLEQYHYLMKLLTWKVQHPHLPTEVALVLRTEAEGAGKDTLFIVLQKIFGVHYRVAANADHLFKWNAGLLSNASIVSIGEMLWSGNHQHAGRFKELITARTVGTEGKYAQPGSTVNTVMYLISSNEDWVVPAGRDARRFFVPDTSSARVGDRTYFNALYKEIDGDGPAALLHTLLSANLGDWHPRDDVPQTRALKNQKLQSLDAVARYWQDCLVAGEVSYGLPSGAKVIEASEWLAGQIVASKEGMRDSFLDWSRRQRLGERRGMTIDEFFRRLRRYAPGGTQRKPGNGRRVGAKFSDHATCLAQFQAALRRK